MENKSKEQEQVSQEKVNEETILNAEVDMIEDFDLLEKAEDLEDLLKDNLDKESLFEDKNITKVNIGNKYWLSKEEFSYFVYDKFKIKTKK